MRVLFIGDVVGSSGCEHLQKYLGGFRKRQEIDICIANGENSAEGNGITPFSMDSLYSAGVDVITTGNHGLRRREIYPLLEQGAGIIRPGNLHPSAPGSGVYLLDKLRYQLCIVNLQGLAYMEPCLNPFSYMDELLPTIQTKNIIVDFHAEATAEKKAMGYYLDGKVSAVLGTHTHVQTADERILPGGTGYLTDVGMCGGGYSVLGVKKELAIKRFVTHLPTRFENDHEDCVMDGVVLEIDSNTGKTVEITRVHL